MRLGSLLENGSPVKAGSRNMESRQLHLRNGESYPSEVTHFAGAGVLERQTSVRVPSPLSVGKNCTALIFHAMRSFENSTVCLRSSAILERWKVRVTSLPWAAVARSLRALLRHTASANGSKRRAGSALGTPQVRSRDANDSDDADFLPLYDDVHKTTLLQPWKCSHPAHCCRAVFAR